MSPDVHIAHGKIFKILIQKVYLSCFLRNFAKVCHILIVHDGKFVYFPDYFPI